MSKLRDPQAAADALRKAFEAQEQPSTRRRRQGGRRTRPVDLGHLDQELLATAAKRARAAGRRGRRPDGSPVSLADKQAALALFERVNAEAGFGPRPAVAASAELAARGLPISPGHATPYGW